MSFSVKKENLSVDENLEEISNNSKYLLSEINSSQKSQNILNKEDSYIISNNQLLQILEPKSILDSKF